MANCFSFSKSKSIVCEDGTVTWSNQMVTQSPLNFSNTEDSLNETYATAVDENETQYLSVLESTHDETFEDLNNLTLSNQKLIIQENIGSAVEAGAENDFNLTDSGDQQVVIFNIEGSDEIYGIQLAQDEDGNVHRYQFQFRKTDDGQLEAMPETIQLLANEEDSALTEEHQETVVELSENQIIEEHFETPLYLQEQLEQTDENTQTHLHIPEAAEEHFYESTDIYGGKDGGMNANENADLFVKREGQVHSEQEEEEEDDMGTEGLEYEEETVDIKPGIEIETVKQELLNDQNLVTDSQDVELDDHEEAVLENINEDYTSEADSYSTTEIQNEGEETVIAYQNFEPQHIEGNYDENEETRDTPEAVQYEQLFIEETDLHNLNYDSRLHKEGEEHEENGNVLIVEKDPGTNDSENEDYEIVEGLPVTAEGEMSEDTSSTIYQETEVLYSEPDVALQTFPRQMKSVPKTTNILKQPTNINRANDDKKKTVVYYMVPNTDQKENLNSLPLNSANPRSLLKNNVEVHKMTDEHVKNLQRERLMEKRYSRSKEAIQAKMFNNFINKTTIPHAPVRQGRLPRKQEIKPVDTRRDEEIIVQEVMVSSKGFVESISDRLKNLDKLEVTSIVELSDSDEDYDSKNGTKKKKKHKKTKPTNTLTSDSDASIIEILNSDDEVNGTEHISRTVKKGRGRPKKTSEESLKRSRGRGSNSGSGDGSSSQKKSRTEESSEVESDIDKKEINCPHCPKTFPNQNSLSTHIQHHNLENSLRNSKKNPAVEYKHKCETCQQNFKNSIILKRHVCNNKDTKNNYKCGVCSKTFRDATLFNMHKKSHIKGNLVKSTTAITISPKKFIPRPSTSTFKCPGKVLGTYKCKECSKVCSSQAILAIHEKSHKQWNCTSCMMSFASKLLLDSHVRLKCVKTSPKDKRLSFKIRKSFVSSPRRASIRRRSINPLKATKPASIASSVTRRSAAPVGNTHLNSVPKRSINPNGNVNPQISKSFVCGSSKSLNAGPNKDFSRSNMTKNDPASVASTSGSVRNNINPGLNTSSMVRTLDVETQCDSCTMKFSSLTALFRHKVKDHGLHTPDKRVLEPKRKGLHKPLNAHGGIRANERLNKAFQEMRKKLALAETDTPEETEAPKETNVLDETSDPSEEPNLPEESEVIKIIIFQGDEPEQ